MRQFYKDVAKHDRQWFLDFWREVPLTADELLSLKAKAPLINRLDEWERTV